MPSTRAHAAAADPDSNADTHTRLRFRSASTQLVSRWSDKDTRNVALLLAVRFQSLRDTNTYADAHLWQAPRCMFCHTMLSWLRMQRCLLCRLSVADTNTRLWHRRL